MTDNIRVGTKLVRSTSLVLALVMTAGIGWNVYSQKKQARLELLEQSRVLAAQVLALRKVTAENQHKINYDSKGNFEFKHLNPAALTRQVSGVFNAGTEYRIRQVSVRPRIPENRPDNYEGERLRSFAQSSAAKESWGEDVVNGERYFRYMMPIYVAPSCLTCHGGPEGETDISGHPREGYKVGDLAGALSISIPMKIKEAGLRNSIGQNIFFTALAIVFSAGVIIFHTNRFVARPIAGLTRFSQELGGGNLAARPDGFKAYGEIRELTARFADMAHQLQEMYDHMELKVDERTRELAAANYELARISRHKSEFLANMSHELRTPLTAILAFTEELLKRGVGQLTAEQEDYLQDIRGSGEELLGLINSLLDLAKIESGKMALNLAEVDIGRTAGQVERLLRPLAQQKDIHVNLTVTGSGKVIADGEKAGQVIRNLLGNAIKFSPPGSSIEVTVADAPAPEEGTLLTVKDTGPGIAPEHREFIFDPFYQAERGLGREFRGTGLGLALVKKIVDLHLGWIKLETSEGRGSAFTVCWPAYPPFDDSLE
jgi:signal transduction histidine kinase